MIREFTAASAARYLDALRDERERVLQDEIDRHTYRCAQGEMPHVPDYDYGATRRLVAALDGRMVAVRHALTSFSATTALPACGLTMDEAELLLGLLAEKRARLDALRTTPARERMVRCSADGASVIIEYEYANFDVELAEQDYREVCDRIEALVAELDLHRQVRAFEVRLLEDGPV